MSNLEEPKIVTMPPAKNPKGWGFKIRQWPGKFFNRFKNNLKNWFQWTKNNKSKAIIISLVVFAVIDLLIGVIWDRTKNFSYVEPQELSYSHLNWVGKADNEGFNHFSNKNTSFDWRVDIYTPETSFVFVVKDIARTRMTIKNIKGTLLIPQSTYFEGMEKYPAEDGWRTVEDLEYITLENEAHFASFLGLNFVSPRQGTTFLIDHNKFNTATIHLPIDSNILLRGDGLQSAGMYDVNENNFLFHDFQNPCIVYYTFGYHLIIQLILASIGILIFVLSRVFRGRVRFKKYQFNKKFCVAAILLTAILMMVFALIFPNPRSIIFFFDNRLDINYETENQVVYDYQIPDYLLWVLAITKSIDAVVVGETIRCGPSIPRHMYLLEKTVDKFYVIDEYKDETCAEYVKFLNPEKVEIISQNEVESKLLDYEDRGYFFDFLFIPNTKIIVLLSNLIIFFGAALITWLAFNIRRPRDYLYSFLYAFGLFFGFILLYIAVGYLAHMPITYHAKNTYGLIMTNYFLPGVIAGGNNLRTLAALLGCLSVIAFAENVAQRIKPYIFLVFGMIVIALLVIPPTEYATKRFLLTFTSAEAYVWDYKLKDLNPFDFYKELRDYNIIGYLKFATSKNTRGERELAFARSLASEERLVEAVYANRNIIVKYDELLPIKSQAHFELGEIYYSLNSPHNQKALNSLETFFLEPHSDFWELGYRDTREYALHLAIQRYSDFLLFDHEVIDYHFDAPYYDPGPPGYREERSIFHRARAYAFLYNFEMAAIGFEDYIRRFPNGLYVNLARYYLAECLLALNRYDQTMIAFEDYIANAGPGDNLVDEAKFGAAKVQARLGRSEEALENFNEIITSDFSENKAYNARARYELALVTKRVSGAEEAKESFRQLLIDFPDDPDIAQQSVSSLAILFPISQRNSYNQFSQIIQELKTNNLAGLEEKIINLSEQTSDVALKANLQFRLADYYLATDSNVKAYEVYQQITEDYEGMVIADYANLKIARSEKNIDEEETYQKNIDTYLAGFVPRESLRVQDVDVVGETEGQKHEKMSTEKPIITQTEFDEDGKKFPVLFSNMPISRGMSLYFAGCLVLAFILLIGINLRTLVLPILLMMLARGFIRVGEQDPFRAIISIWPGFLTGVQVLVALLILSFLIKVILHPKESIPRFKKSKDYFKDLGHDLKHDRKSALNKFKQALKPRTEGKNISNNSDKNTDLLVK